MVYKGCHLPVLYFSFETPVVEKMVGFMPKEAMLQIVERHL